MATEYDADLTEAERNANTAATLLAQAASVLRPDDAATMATLGVGYAVLSLGRPAGADVPGTVLPFAGAVEWAPSADRTVSDLPGTGGLLYELGCVRLADLSPEKLEELHVALQNVMLDHLPPGTPRPDDTPAPTPTDAR